MVDRSRLHRCSRWSRETLGRPARSPYRLRFFSRRIIGLGFPAETPDLPVESSRRKRFERVPSTPRARRARAPPLRRARFDAHSRARRDVRHDIRLRRDAALPLHSPVRRPGARAWLCRRVARLLGQLIDAGGPGPASRTDCHHIHVHYVTSLDPSTARRRHWPVFCS